MMFPHRTTSPLSSVAPFDQLAPAALREIEPHVDRLQMRAGTVLAREGHRAREFIVVLRGEVAATRGGSDVDHLGPGTQIGGRALLDGSVHARTWQATSDLDVLVLNAQAYRWASRFIAADAAA
jgi:CRP-like cAMP-binding protein